MEGEGRRAGEGLAGRAAFKKSSFDGSSALPGALSLLLSKQFAVHSVASRRPMSLPMPSRAQETIPA